MCSQQAREMESAATRPPSLLLLTEQLIKINWSQIETARAKSICVLKQLTALARVKQTTADST